MIVVLVFVAAWLSRAAAQFSCSSADRSWWANRRAAGDFSYFSADAGAPALRVCVRCAHWLLHGAGVCREFWVSVDGVPMALMRVSGQARVDRSIEQLRRIAYPTEDQTVANIPAVHLKRSSGTGGTMVQATGELRSFATERRNGAVTVMAQFKVGDQQIDTDNPPERFPDEFIFGGG